MIEDDVEVFRRRVLADKLFFLLYFCLVCAAVISPMLLLVIFAYSLPGRLALLFSVVIFAVAMFFITRTASV
ncbi:MAG: hypothetical protein AB1384_01055 [Actinomycetota bacterium]